jgi:hypothetical protein
MELEMAPLIGLSEPSKKKLLGLETGDRTQIGKKPLLGLEMGVRTQIGKSCEVG